MEIKIDLGVGKQLTHLSFPPLYPRLNLTLSFPTSLPLPCFLRSSYRSMSQHFHIFKIGEILKFSWQLFLLHKIEEKISFVCNLLLCSVLHWPFIRIKYSHFPLPSKQQHFLKLIIAFSKLPLFDSNTFFTFSADVN